MKGLHKDSLRKVDNPHQWMIDDARMELIQQIKAKIEQLKKDVDNTPLATEQIAGYLFALVDVQKLLSTLQVQPVDWQKVAEAHAKDQPLGQDNDGNLVYLQEQPICEELEEASDGYAEKHGFRVPYDASDNFYDDVDVKASKEGFIAGAKWQMKKDLSSINKSYESGVVFGMNAQKEQNEKELSEKIASAYQLGLADKEKQMMKEAVEGKIIFLLNGDVAVNIGDTDEYKLGQKVRIIIVKEEKK